MKKRLLFSLGLVMALAIGAAEFHVAPTGNDANPGTEAKPLASIAKAREAARLSSDKSKAILLAPGQYFNDAAIVLDDRDSGLTIKGTQPGALAEVYGGVPVAGWEKWQGEIWRAPVPKGQRFFNLIVDGQPAPMAQWPKAGSGFGGGFGPRGNGAVFVPPEFRNADFADAQVFAFIGGNWFSEMREAQAAVPDANGILKVDGGSGQFGGMNGRIQIRGVLAFLSEPGEWCLKHQEGWLYYWPKSGTPADHLIVRPTAEKLFDIHGRTPQTPARNIAIENLTIVGSDFCARWYLFGPGKDGSTPEPLQQGLVFGENVETLKISGCRLQAAGHSAVWLNKYAQNCVVENCLITGAGFAGVYANGFMPGEGPFKDAAESYVNKGHRLENNFIYDCGRNVGGGCGIQFYQAGDSLITRNEIGQMPRYGISFKGIRWGCIPKTLYGNKVTFDTHFDYLHTRNLKVTGNEIYSVCRNSFDFGGIESWSPGRDNLWAENDLHDIDQTLDWNGWAHVLFADDASHYLTIRGNILHHCNGGRATGAVMLKSIGQVFENNLIADCTIGRGVSWQAYIEPGGDYTIRRNIFALNSGCPYYDVDQVVFTGYAGTAGKLPPGVGGAKEVDYNVITPRNPAKPNEFADKGVDTHSVFGDAKIIRAKPDWEMTARDYALAPDSPALKLGFKPVDATAIGLRPNFPFDKAAVTRRHATDKIQAEDYQRQHDLRTQAGTGLYNLVPASWAKYANIDFGAGVAQAVFTLDAEKPDPKAEKTFIRRYGDTVVEATHFRGGAATIIEQWEVSDSYTMKGKTGLDLFDTAFAPEKDITAGQWKPWLAPMTARDGITTARGVVNIDVANGEKNVNACAYLRSSIYIPSLAGFGQNTTAFILEHTAGVKLWINGELVLAENRPGTHKTTKDVALKQGWNTLLLKANQDDRPRGPESLSCANFSVKVDLLSSLWPVAVYLPGLPTQERGTSTGGNLVELRLDSPKGKLIGRLAPGQTACPVEKTAGLHNLYLVFPGNQVRTVDYFRFK